MVQLSVLDLIPVRRGQSNGQALASSFALAQVADRSNCIRYWVAEHHNTASVASTNPPVLIAMLASRTDQIRVGSGGVMLPNHAPLVVAEQFALLEAAFPGRIDLGIGRAPGTDPVTSWALRGGRPDETLREFPSWVNQVIALLGDNGLGVDIDGRRFEIKASPQPVSAPPVWLLGSSGYSAALAGELGLPYVFAHHFSGQGADEALRIYRQSFQGEGRPKAFVSVNVVVAKDAGTARRLSLPYQHAMAQLRLGRPIELMTVEQAERAPQPLPAEAWQAITEPWLIGEPHQVAESIFELTDRFDVDEVMIHPVAGAFDADPMDRYPAREYAVRELAARLVEYLV